MNPDDVLKFGIYKNYKFNEKDEHLRKAGFYCEEIFSYTDFPLVLRRIAREEPPMPSLCKLAILPAEEVIIGSNMTGRFALYMQIEGRLKDLKIKESKLETVVQNENSSQKSTIPNS